MKLTAEQLRAARALVRIEQSVLADQSGVGLATIKRLETATGELKAQDATIANLRSALEAAGVIFLDDKEGTPRGGPGVRLAEKKTEPSDEHIEWVQTRLLKAVETQDVEGLSPEDQRQKRLVAIVSAVDEAGAEFLWKFGDADTGLFRNALSKALANIIGYRPSVSPSLPKRPRKHYDRLDPESGASMKGSRPVARRLHISDIKPSSQDDEAE